MLRGVAWSPLSTTPVLCANKAGQLIYTVRLQLPAAAMNQLRSTAGTPSMRTVYTPASFRTLKLSGEAGKLSISVHYNHRGVLDYKHKSWQACST
jgi:hypothetical protein